jgi:serine/threonine protein kinase
VYFLLSRIQGNLPFGNDNDRDLFSRIRTADYDMEGTNWRKTSIESRQVVNGLLELNPQQRLTVNQVLQHPWIQNQLPLLEKLYHKL